MKPVLFISCMLASIFCSSQPATPVNIFIISTDGLRWQEVFRGAAEELLTDVRFVKDTALSREMFWEETLIARRKKLMPFLWSVVEKGGQLHGNRDVKNKVNVSNLYKVSYPGYNEILTGYADPLLMSNKPRNNPNDNLLEFLNNKPAYHNKVVAFSSWNVFPYILNEQRSGFPVNSGYNRMSEKDAAVNMINKVQDSVLTKEATRYDQLTFLQARQYLGQFHPKVLMLSLGETDESAHQKQYDKYLQQAKNFDNMLAELWYMVQTDPFYKDNTLFVITTDHGRGSKPSKWYSHSMLVEGSSETWLALLGPGINPVGEMKSNTQIWQKQIAATVAGLAGQNFEANHPVAAAFQLPVSVYTKQHEIATMSFPTLLLSSPGALFILSLLLISMRILLQKRNSHLQQ